MTLYDLFITARYDKKSHEVLVGSYPTLAKANAAKARLVANDIIDAAAYARIEEVSFPEHNDYTKGKIRDDTRLNNTYEVVGESYRTVKVDGEDPVCVKVFHTKTVDAPLPEKSAR